MVAFKKSSLFTFVCSLLFNHFDFTGLSTAGSALLHPLKLSFIFPNNSFFTLFPAPSSLDLLKLLKFLLFNLKYSRVELDDEDVAADESTSGRLAESLLFSRLSENACVKEPLREIDVVCDNGDDCGKSDDLLLDDNSDGVQLEACRWTRRRMDPTKRRHSYG